MLYYPNFWAQALEPEPKLVSLIGLMNYNFLSGPVILGSAPGAGAFFVTYETSKKTFQNFSSKCLNFFLRQLLQRSGRALAA